LCIQKNFLPKNIKQCLIEQPENFEDFDILVLYKLNELYNDFLNIKSYEGYIKFFENFKKVAQNIFFSRYLEIQKINPSKNTKFICSYFFNFLLTLLYPLIPEFVEAIQYISNKEFVFPINSIKLDKSVDYSTNTLYNTFIKIKEIKLECNIKQHEPCNIFIKSNPSILEFFINHDSIFKNYFHIPEILYLRLHEQTPL
jgi:valyl-tRNA synthetase